MKTMVKLIKRLDEIWFPVKEVAGELDKVGEEGDKPSKPDPDIKRLSVLKEEVDKNDRSGKVEEKLLVKGSFFWFFLIKKIVETFTQ